MDPDFLASKRGLHYATAIDVAMVEELCFSLAPEFQAVCSSTKALTERANEPAFLVKDNDRLAAHA